MYQLDWIIIFSSLHNYQVSTETDYNRNKCPRNYNNKKFGNYHSIRFVLFIHRIGGSRCHPRWHHQGMYLRCTQGFLQSAPQLVLQTLILFKVINIKTFFIISQSIDSAIAFIITFKRLFQGIHITSLGEVVQELRMQPTFDFDLLWNQVVITEHTFKW